MCLSDSEREWLEQNLNKLTEAQFGRLCRILNVPPNEIPFNANLGVKIHHLYLWAQSPAGCGLRKLYETLLNFLSEEELESRFNTPDSLKNIPDIEEYWEFWEIRLSESEVYRLSKKIAPFQPSEEEIIKANLQWFRDWKQIHYKTEIFYSRYVEIYDYLKSREISRAANLLDFLNQEVDKFINEFQTLDSFVKLFEDDFLRSFESNSRINNINEFEAIAFIPKINFAILRNLKSDISQQKLNKITCIIREIVMKCLSKSLHSADLILDSYLEIANKKS